MKTVAARPAAATIIALRQVNWHQESDVTSVRAQMFGHMVTLAMPIVRHYASDLYHDAGWLTRHLTHPKLVFFFAARECGTSVGTDARLVTGDHVWRVHLQPGTPSGHLTAVFQPMAS